MHSLNCNYHKHAFFTDTMLPWVVFLEQYDLTKFDIHGNPFFPDINGSGIPTPRAVLDAAWKKGVMHELHT